MCGKATNKENRTLLTFTGRDAFGLTYIFLRVFLPNQQAWSFRWVFRTVLPKLIPADALSRVQVVLTDGDSQETSQLDSIIRDKYPSWLRVRCGWHLVNRGMATAGLRVSCINDSSLVNSLLREISEWMYTWMAGDRSGSCETNEEYEISKALFFNFMYSEKVVGILGRKGVENAISFGLSQ